jgi:hypothetical protein
MSINFKLKIHKRIDLIYINDRDQITTKIVAIFFFDSNIVAIFNTSIKHYLIKITNVKHSDLP